MQPSGPGPPPRIGNRWVGKLLTRRRTRQNNLAVALILLMILGAELLEAQSAGAGRAGPGALPREREIALARSAAPRVVSRDATIMVLT